MAGKVSREELLFIMKMRDEATAILKKAGGEFKNTAKDAAALKKEADKSAVSMKDVASAIGGVVAAFAVFKTSAGAFRDFEKGMAEVNTLIPDATTRMGELNNEVVRMGLETGTSLDVLVGGLYQTISAMGDTTDTLDLLRIASQTATAGVADVDKSVGLLSAVMKGYGEVSAEAADKVSDLAFTTVKLGETTIPQLARSMFRVTGIAGAMGVSMEELFGTFATGTGVLGRAAEVSTGLRGVLQSLDKPTADMVKLYDQWGVSTGKQAIQQQGLANILKAVKDEADKQ
jgi:TP901 family phage tail tape measure protein